MTNDDDPIRTENLAIYPGRDNGGKADIDLWVIANPTYRASRPPACTREEWVELAHEILERWGKK